MAFSEHCHSNCIEGSSGLLENPMVTYLLTFSIIMLQTDRHNPNIREDRKMTLEQFIRNNTNYGSDISQTKPLPREFLEYIFHDICEHPIRTEKNDYTSVMRIETWEELQLSVAALPGLSFIVSTSYSIPQLEALTSSGYFQFPAYTFEDPLFVSSLALTPEEAASDFLLHNLCDRALFIAEHISGCHELVDGPLINGIWKHILSLSIFPFANDVPVLEPISAVDGAMSSSSIRTGIDFILFTLKVSTSYGLEDVNYFVLTVVAALAGTFRDYVLHSLLNVIDGSGLEIDPEIDDSTGFKRSVSAGIAFLTTQMNSMTARSALGTYLQLMVHNPAYFSQKSWTVAFCVLGLLRDCCLLPETLLSDADGDWLPVLIREDFERCLPYDDELYFETLSKHGIYNIESEELTESSPFRWDDGYHGQLSRRGVSSLIILTCSQNSVSDESFRASFESLKELVSSCAVDGIITGSRFLSDKQLCSFVAALIFCSELCGRQPLSLGTSNTNEGVDDLLDAILKASLTLSFSSCAWLEMVIVESSVRNRERFGLMCSPVVDHYLSFSSLPNPSYVAERRIFGLLKIAARMLSRPLISGQIIEVLHRVFVEVSSDEFRCALVGPYAPLISVGVYRIFTHNVSTLPLLSLMEWQTLFELTALGSKAGGFSSIKAFESIAWLLHEPRLRAEVPLFCISALDPLLGNATVPLTVSLGALQLLCQLHSRQEVLFKDANSDGPYRPELNTDAPLLWESCWTPLLEALRNGVNDPRLEVKTSALHALMGCVLDEHSKAAPAPVFVSVVVDILFPCVLSLKNSWVKNDPNSQPPDAGYQLDLVLYGVNSISRLLVANLERILATSSGKRFWTELIEFMRSFFNLSDYSALSLPEVYQTVAALVGDFRLVVEVGVRFTDVIKDDSLIGSAGDDFLQTTLLSPTFLVDLRTKCGVNVITEDAASSAGPEGESFHAVQE